MRVITKNPSMITMICLTLVSLGIAKTALAADKESVIEAIKVMCDKTTQCMVKAMDAEGIPKNMQSMMTQQVNTQCQQTIALGPHLTDETLDKKAMACINEMNQASCEELMNDAEFKACEEYSQYAEQLGQ